MVSFTHLYQSGEIVGMMIEKLEGFSDKWKNYTGRSVLRGLISI